MKALFDSTNSRGDGLALTHSARKSKQTPQKCLKVQKENISPTLFNKTPQSRSEKASLRLNTESSVSQRDSNKKNLKFDCVEANPRKQREELLAQFNKVHETINKIKNMNCTVKCRIQLMESMSEKLQKIAKKIEEVNSKLREQKARLDYRGEESVEKELADSALTSRTHLKHSDRLHLSSVTKSLDFSNLCLDQIHGNAYVIPNLQLGRNELARISSKLHVPWTNLHRNTLDLEKLNTKIIYAKEVQKELLSQFASALEEFSNIQGTIQKKEAALCEMTKKAELYKREISKLSEQGLTTPRFVQHLKHFSDGSKARILKMDYSSSFENLNYDKQLGSKSKKCSREITKIEISKVDLSTSRSKLSISSILDIGNSFMGLVARKISGKEKMDSLKILPDDL